MQFPLTDAFKCTTLGSLARGVHVIPTTQMMYLILRGKPCAQQVLIVTMLSFKLFCFHHKVLYIWFLKKIKIKVRASK